MTYPGPFLRLVASGTLHDVEQWSWGLSLVPSFNNDPQNDAPDAVPPAIVSAVQTFHSGTYISKAARLTTLKLNLIGPNGRYLNEGETVVHDYGNPGVAGPGPNILFPPQIALAVSLLTARSRGLANKGRFYLPSPSIGVSDDGRIGANMAEAVAGQVTTMLTAINDALPGFVVGVASDTRTGAFQPVTNVRVGRVLDTIRTRRSRLKEDYYVAGPIEPT